MFSLRLLSRFYCSSALLFRLVCLGGLETTYGWSSLSIGMMAQRTT